MTESSVSEKTWLENFSKLPGVQNLFERKVRFVAYLTQALSAHQVRPVVVGGQAVEFYTTGGYSTGDIDLVSPGRDLVGKYLEMAGFSKMGRFWHHSGFDLFVEIPGSALTSDEEAHLTEVRTEVGPVFFIGVEDIILDRLNALVHWKSEEDGRWAKELLIIHGESVDWNYLDRKTRVDGTANALEVLKKEAEKR